MLASQHAAAGIHRLSCQPCSIVSHVSVNLLKPTLRGWSGCSLALMLRKQAILQRLTSSVIASLDPGAEKEQVHSHCQLHAVILQQYKSDNVQS